MIVNDLIRFDFTIKEYQLDKDQIIDKALSYLPPDAYSRTEVQQYLDCLFLEKKQKSVVWDKIIRPFKDGDMLSCTLDGEYISGKVHVTPKLLEVSIWNNGTIKTLSSELLSYAPTIYTEEPFEGSYANQIALLKAKSLLLDLIFFEKE